MTVFMALDKPNESSPTAVWFCLDNAHYLKRTYRNSGNDSSRGNDTLLCRAISGDFGTTDYWILLRRLLQRIHG